MVASLPFTRLSRAIIRNETWFYKCYKFLLLKEKGLYLRHWFQNLRGLHTFKLLLLLWKASLHETYIHTVYKWKCWTLPLSWLLPGTWRCWTSSLLQFVRKRAQIFFAQTILRSHLGFTQHASAIKSCFM